MTEPPAVLLKYDLFGESFELIVLGDDQDKGDLPDLPTQRETLTRRLAEYVAFQNTTNNAVQQSSAKGGGHG